MNERASLLTPTWSRIIHRLHALGSVKTSYLNTIGELNEIGNYPQHIPSYNEKESQSVDGTTFWNFLNWHQGWVEQATNNTQGSQFSFSSINNRVFHQLSILEAKEDECLNCLLQLFAESGEPEPLEEVIQMPSRPAPIHAVANLLERAVERKVNGVGRDMKLDFITEGGLVSKKLRAKDLKLNGKFLDVEFTNDTTLQIDTAAISHVHNRRSQNIIRSTFYNATNSPQISLQISA